MFNTLYKKCLDLAAHKSSKYYLALVSFIESSFFPIPPDVMVIPMVISKKSSTKLFTSFNSIIWWAKRESNSHFLRNTILSRARLPVPPFALIV